jgi:Galactose oxidase, central domain
MIRTGRVSCSGGRWLTAAASLAALAIPAASQSAALASSPPVPAWTEQAPASSPQALFGASMTYDAATGNVVMVGGTHRIGADNYLAGTWVWDGSTWTKQTPATSAPARFGAAMTYDAATGNAVLFGGESRQNGAPRDTWAWNGSTWTKQTPATSPPGRFYPAMAYDAATGNVVMFGGETSHGHVLADTWVWDGSTWTKQTPATSPPARFGAAMTYDAATGNVVMFSGYNSHYALKGTWVWNGSTWTKQAPAASPPTRWGAAMAYDAAAGNVVMFGGYDPATGRDLTDTWVWDGSTWTQQAPATSPSARDEPSAAYDVATGNVVMFGGFSPAGGVLGDTWTWG